MNTSLIKPLSAAIVYHRLNPSAVAKLQRPKPYQISHTEKIIRNLRRTLEQTTRKENSESKTFKYIAEEDPFKEVLQSINNSLPNRYKNRNSSEDRPFRVVNLRKITGSKEKPTIRTIGFDKYGVLETILTRSADYTTKTFNKLHKFILDSKVTDMLAFTNGSNPQTISLNHAIHDMDPTNMMKERVARKTFTWNGEKIDGWQLKRYYGKKLYQIIYMAKESPDGIAKIYSLSKTEGNFAIILNQNNCKTIKVLPHKNTVVRTKTQDVPIGAGKKVFGQCQEVYTNKQKNRIIYFPETEGVSGSVSIDIDKNGNPVGKTSTIEIDNKARMYKPIILMERFIENITFGSGLASRWHFFKHLLYQDNCDIR